MAEKNETAKKRPVGRKKPYFYSQDYFRYPRLRKRWRKPKGLQSKLRISKSGSGVLPRVGWRSPRAVRGKVRVGSEYYNAVMVANVAGLGRVKAPDVAILSSSLGTKRVLELAEHAEKTGVTIIYKKKIVNARLFVEERKKIKEKRKSEREKKVKQEKAEAQKAKTVNEQKEAPKQETTPASVPSPDQSSADTSKGE